MMNSHMMCRREFAKGAMGLFGWGMFAGALGGCSTVSGGSGPRLVFGVVSDIHFRMRPLRTYLRLVVSPSVDSFAAAPLTTVHDLPQG